MLRDLFALIALVLLLMLVGTAHAASLKMCWDDASTTNADTVSAFLGGQPLYPDLLPGSTLATGKRCSTQSIPPTLVRGTNLSLTLKQTNALQEVSGASNAVTFLVPLSPTAPTGLAVQIVVP